jgi:hypothetical protein
LKCFLMGLVTSHTSHRPVDAVDTDTTGCQRSHRGIF